MPWVSFWWQLRLVVMTQPKQSTSVIWLVPNSDKSVSFHNFAASVWSSLCATKYLNKITSQYIAYHIPSLIIHEVWTWGSVGREHYNPGSRISAITTGVRLWDWANNDFLCAQDCYLSFVCLNPVIVMMCDLSSKSEAIQYLLSRVKSIPYWTCEAWGSHDNMMKFDFGMQCRIFCACKAWTLPAWIWPPWPTHRSIH